MPRTRTNSKDQPTLTEKGGDPKHISWVLDGLEHEQTQERNVNEREDERQREGVDQDRLCIVLWLNENWETGGIHDHNGRNERA